MDALTHMLEHVTSNVQLLPSVRAAAACGKAVLDKYYSLTDDSVMYRLAMSKCLYF